MLFWMKKCFLLKIIIMFFLSKLLLEKMGSKLKIDVVEENITDTVIEYEEYNE